MKSVASYLRHAQECEALAARAMSAEQREQIMRVAETWRLLAEQRTKRLEGSIG